MIILIAASTGMRISEILALKWDDIDFKNNEINVRRALKYRRRKGMILDELKTKGSKRIIAVDYSILEKLDEYRIFQNQMKVA